MATNKVTEWIRNVGKSVVYATVKEVTTDMMPSVGEFTESNSELFKEVYKDIKDYKNTVRRATEYIKASPPYKAGKLAAENAFEDLKSGKIYNADREIEADNEAIGLNENGEIEEPSFD